MSGMVIVCCFFFFFKQKTAYEMLRSLVGSEMCIRDRFELWLMSRAVFVGAIRVFSGSVYPFSYTMAYNGKAQPTLMSLEARCNHYGIHKPGVDA